MWKHNPQRLINPNIPSVKGITQCSLQIFISAEQQIIRNHFHHFPNLISNLSLWCPPHGSFLQLFPFSLNWFTGLLVSVQLQFIPTLFKIREVLGGGDRKLMAALVQMEWQLIYYKGYKGKVLSVFHSTWQKASCTMSNKTQESPVC